MVDAKVYEIKKACGDDKELIIKYVKEMYNIDIKGVTSKNGEVIYRIYNSIKRPLFVQENSCPDNIEGAVLNKKRGMAA